MFSWSRNLVFVHLKDVECRIIVFISDISPQIFMLASVVNWGVKQVDLFSKTSKEENVTTFLRSLAKTSKVYWLVSDLDLGGSGLNPHSAKSHTFSLTYLTGLL
ncbi:UNVERIFIED_CONTAM: hypothetical protein K2H54_047028 [Gekko kuhli]